MIGFTTGVWAGWYEYSTGQKELTGMDVTMINGILAGYGNDTVIVFS
jgi:hypothetical protein